MPSVVDRLRALLEEIELRRALVGVVVLLALSLLILLSLSPLFGLLYLRQQAEQAAIKGETTSGESEAKDVPLVFGPGPSDRRLLEATSTDGRVRGIPGLSEMDVIGNLKYLPNTDFRCSGPSPDQGLISRCASLHRGRIRPPPTR